MKTGEELQQVASLQDVQAFLASPGKFDSSREGSPLLYTTCDQDRNTSLILAIKGGHEDAFGVLLSSGLLGLDVQNVKGVTALALSAQKGRASCLSRLLDAGAQVDLANFNGSTALIQVPFR
jgi:ankyrin repeat protein